jgi:hypothetical protein
MLKRIGMTLSWQRLIGIASGTLGAATVLGTVAQLSSANSFYALARTSSSIGAGCGCVFLLLAFPLYTGREWARRALLFIIYCIVFGLAIFLSFRVFQQSRLSAVVSPVLRLFLGICSLVGFLTPPAFILGVLHHADVRRAFQKRI